MFMYNTWQIQPSLDSVRMLSMVFCLVGSAVPVTDDVCLAYD